MLGNFLEYLFTKIIYKRQKTQITDKVESCFSRRKKIHYLQIFLCLRTEYQKDRTYFVNDR